jgi:hypothetical protein
LAGAQELIRTWHPVLFVEIHPSELQTFGASAESVIRSLRQQYQTVRMFLPSERRFRNRIGRAVSRYLLPGLTEIRKIDAFLEERRMVPAELPFWTVCT